jgi:hypothetical protein
MNKSHSISTRIPAGLLPGLAILLLGFATTLAAQNPASEIAWQHTGRAYVDFSTYKAVYVGYMIHINGIPNPLFSGGPSEQNAYFTFSTTFDLTPFNNGPITIFLVSPGTVNIYYHASPSNDWSDPDTFSSGELIGTIRRQETFFPIVGPIALCNHSESLVYSRDFTFKGHTFNLNRLVPHGVTFSQVFSSTPMGGAGWGNYTAVFPSVGVVTAIGSKISSVGPSAN